MFQRFVNLLQRLWARLSWTGGVHYLNGGPGLPPPLTPEEEKALLARMADGDPAARDELITHNHETANEEHYRYLHPENLSSANRKQCLYDLKELGYQIGAGFMVGAPGQTMEYLADDLVFLKELNPHMVGIGPFIPHHDTKFAEEPAGSVDLTLFLLSVIRIMLPQVLLPATTALGTLDPRGREKGFQAGANVVMPNLSPVKNRKQYELYDNKICTGEEAAECRGCLSRRVESVGYEIVTDRGDSPMMLH